MKKKMNLYVVIPSSQQHSGISKGYFEDYPMLNLLPLGHKSTIQQLVEDLLKFEELEGVKDLCQTKNILIVSSDANCRRYSHILGTTDKRWECRSSSVLSQYYGIYYAVREGIRQLEQQYEVLDGPILVNYGDTLLRDSFWQAIIEKAYKKYQEAPLGCWVILGFVDYHKEIQEHSNWEYLTRNRRGIAIVDMEAVKKEVKETVHGKYFVVDAEAIMDFVSPPFYPEIEFGKIEKNMRPFVKTGVLVFSPKGWRAFETTRENLRERLRPTHMSAILRTVLAQNEDIHAEAICGIPTGNKKIWMDINYPWELMENYQDILVEIRDHYEPSNYKEFRLDKKTRGDHHNLEGSGYEIVLPAKTYQKLKPYIDKQEIKLVKNVEDVAPGIILGGAVLKPQDKQINLQRGAVIEGICVIEEECLVERNAVVKWSILRRGVKIHSSSLIDHCIIFENTTVLSYASVTYSIIGKNVSISYHATIPCQKLKNIGLKPRDREPELFYTEIMEARHKERFGAIIGDNVKLGMGTLVEPGRKIGMNCIVHPGCEIRKNYGPSSIIKKEIIEEFLP